jgi:hypothetical protein
MSPMSSKTLLTSVLSLALVGSAAGALIQPIASAEGLPGITFRWNNNGQKFTELRYAIDHSTVPNGLARYRLRLGPGDMKLAASQFSINYLDAFDGDIDAKNIELRTCKKAGSILSNAKCTKVPVDEITYDPAVRRISIYPTQPVPAGSNVEIVLSNVRNPTGPGMYQMNALVESPGDTPMLRYVGSWLLTIASN